VGDFADFLDAGCVHVGGGGGEEAEERGGGGVEEVAGGGVEEHGLGAMGRVVDWKKREFRAFLT